MQTNSKEKIVKTFQASIFIGLEIGYSQKPIEENAVIESLSELQKQISEQKNIFLVNGSFNIFCSFYLESIHCIRLLVCFIKIFL